MKVLKSVSISVFGIGLFIFSISSWFSLRRSYRSKNLSVPSRLSILLAYSCFQESLNSVHFFGVSCNFYFIISNFIDLSPIGFFLDESG